MWTFFALFYALFFTYYTLYFPAVGKKKEKHEINVGIYFCIVPTICFISLFHGNCSLLPLLPLVPLFIEITFFVCTKEKNLILRQSSDRLVIVAKGFLKLPNLHILIKQESTSQKLGSRDFGRIVNSIINKGKSAIPPLSNSPEVLSSASDKAKLLAENVSKNSNLDDSGRF